MTEQIAKLMTEQFNSNSTEIDQMESEAIVRLINGEDKTVALAVEKVLPQVAQAVDLVVAGLKRNGRMIYVGAGTSGRLGELDASECPPTFGIAPDRVTFAIAGGNQALLKAIEGAEDHAHLGRENLIDLQLRNTDVVVAISASGRTPYCIGALQYAREIRAATVSISCNDSSEMSLYADVAIEVLTGPEVLVGSTRLKAGTAQKMILNMLSTATMIRLGKVYQNLMVDMQPTNIKLQERAKRMVIIATGCHESEAVKVLEEANWHVKTAIVVIQAKTKVDAARKLLDQTEGFVRKAIELNS